MEAFVANFQRTASFAIMPSHIAAWVRRDQAIADYTLQQTGGELKPDLSQFDNPFPSQYHSEFLRNARDYLASLTPEKDKEQLGRWGVEYIEQLLATIIPMRKSMEGILSAIIIESWTAFESLSSDLWVAAVDYGPRELRLRVANTNQLLKPDDNIGPKQLFEAEYDPSKNYGSSLRELGRVSFQKLDYIKRFYAIAFNHDLEQMFKEVEDGYIKALAAFRNALIHNAGKADKHFTRQVASFPELRSIKPNEPLLLDGALVKRLQNTSLSLGTRLLQFVDAILAPPLP